MGAPASGRYLSDSSRRHGLKRISQHGGFCGSPKWTPDSKSVVTYCMSAQDTWTYRFGSEDGDDQLVKIDIASGETTPVPAGPGVKLLPAVLPSGEIAYLRRDKAGQGVFYASGKPGPKGDDLRISLLVARRRAGRLQPLCLQAHCRAGEALEPESELRLVQHRMAARIRSQRRTSGGDEDESRQDTTESVHRG